MKNVEKYKQADIQRGRDREIERDTQSDRQTDRDKDRDRERKTVTERPRNGQSQRSSGK